MKNITTHKLMNKRALDQTTTTETTLNTNDKRITKQLEVDRKMLKCCRKQKQLQAMMSPQLALLLLTLLASFVINTFTLVECQDSSFDQDLSQQHQHPSASQSFLSRQQTIGQQHAVNSRHQHQHQLSRLSSQQQIQASSSNVNVQAAPAPALATPTAPATPNLASSTQQATHPHRPLLSSRFAAAQAAALGASSASSGQQALQAAASSGSFQSTLSAPTTTINQQQASPLSRQSASVAPNSSIEQMMKSAISRSSEPASRQTAPAGQQQSSPAGLAPVAAAQTAANPQQTSAAQQQQQQQESSRLQTVESPSDNNKATTTTINDAGESGATTTLDGSSNVHETVYSDQRFANLFARRQNLRKSRLVPTEQAKAKPTLPSFIKSLPDPKQFPSTPTVDQERALAPQTNSGNAFLSQRVQAANQKALAFQQAQSQTSLLSKVKPNSSNNSNASISKIKPNQAKSPSVGSALATSGKQIKQTAASSSDSTSSIGRPKATSSNPGNPFATRSNSNSNSNSSESIIATARKRLLANNALEAAKLKKAEQQQQAQSQ